MVTRLSATLVSLFLLAAAATAADAPPPRPMPVTATIEALSGQALTVKSATGQELTLTLSPDTKITRSRKGTVADVKPGQFIGCTAVAEPDGTLHAREIHILPETMRGAGEGHYPWGNTPQTTMTNGNIETLAGITDGHVITVSYKGGRSTIAIPRHIKVTLIEPASRAALVPGAKVTLFTHQNADGSLSVPFIGLAP